MPLATSTHTAAEILEAVKRQFGDESATQINNRDIYRWINQGQREIVQRGEVNKGTLTTTSTAGTNAVTFPDNVFKVLAVYFDGSPLAQSTFEQIQESVTTDRADAAYQSTPQLWYEWNSDLTLYPTPNASDKEIKIYAIKAPVEITNSTDTLSIPDTHYQALLQYVLQQAYELDEDWNGAATKSAQHDESMTNLHNASGYKTYQTITILPEDM